MPASKLFKPSDRAQRGSLSCQTGVPQASQSISSILNTPKFATASAGTTRTSALNVFESMAHTDSTQAFPLTGMCNLANEGVCAWGGSGYLGR